MKNVAMRGIPEHDPTQKEDVHWVQDWFALFYNTFLEIPYMIKQEG